MIQRFNYIINQWQAVRGDHTFWSWVITAAYFITIFLTFRYTWKHRENRPLRFLWTFISIFVLLMGINKQLDVQILVTLIGRFCAYHLGLRQYRYVIYFAFFLGLFLAMVTGFTILFIRSRSVISRSKLPLGGVLVLMFFVLIRAGYIHVEHVHGLELLGILMILAGSLRGDEVQTA